MWIWLVACSDVEPTDTRSPADDTAATSTSDDSGSGATDDTGSADTAEGVAIDWDPSCNPLNVGNDCLTPFPSAVWFEEDEDSFTGLRLALDNSLFWSPDGELPLDLATFNLTDGVSPLSPLLVNFGVDVHEAFLSGSGEQEDTVQPGAPIALVHAETGEPVPVLTEMDQANRHDDSYDDRHALILRPLAPLDFEATYYAVLTTELTDADGASLPSSPVFEALRDGVITNDATIEASRSDHDAMFAALESAGWAREDLHLAWPIPVVSQHFALEPIRAMREAALADIEASGVPYTIDEVEVDPSEHVAWRVKGTFSPPSFLGDDNRLVFDDDFTPVLQETREAYPFTLTVPAVARERGDLRVTLVGHGLFGTGEGMLTGSGADAFTPSANEMATVLVATDWIGLSGSDYELIVTEILAELENVRVVTDRLAQSHVNNLALVELVFADLMQDATFTVDHTQPLIGGVVLPVARIIQKLFCSHCHQGCQIRIAIILQSVIYHIVGGDPCIGPPAASQVTFQLLVRISRL